MKNYTNKLEPGVHIISFPNCEPCNLRELFPVELAGSEIEILDANGTWVNKDVIKLEKDKLVIPAAYNVISPLPTFRLTLVHPIELLWKVRLDQQAITPRINISFRDSFDYEHVLPLAKLACLMYSQEQTVKATVEHQYDFDTYYYHSTASHRGMLNRGFLHQLYVYFKGKRSVVDLQFLYLSKLDKKTGKRLIVVVFQGSNKPQDWMTNATFQRVDFMNRGEVHQGFYGAFKLFYRSLKTKRAKTNKMMLNQLLRDTKTFNEMTNIIFVGHSLGGAIATLASCYLHELGVSRDIMKVYSFGAPPIGSKPFADYFTGKINIHRLVNDLDVVPKFDTFTNLYHIGEPIVMQSNDSEIHSCNGYVDNIIDGIQNEIKTPTRV